MSDDIGEDSPRRKDREPPYSRQESQRSDQAANRVRWLVVVTAIAVLAVVLVMMVRSGGGDSSQAQQGRAQASPVTRGIDALLAGIPQSGNALGSSTAPVTLQFFGDLECPISRKFTLGALPSLIRKWVRGGQLRIEYRSLRTATHEAGVFTTQQTAALAAGTQNRLWYYVESFYHEQGSVGTHYVTAGYLTKLAEQTPGLNLALWRGDRESPPLTTQVAFDEQTAAGEGFRSAPSFLIGHTGSSHPMRLLKFSPTEPGAFSSAIEKLLSQRSTSQAAPS
jgi:protein-disulfide isomerase